MRHLGEDRQTETNQTIAPHFQKYARQKDTAPSWSLRVGIWEPGMKRQHRQLYGKPKK